MFCGNCGTQLDEGLKFCTKCGAKLERETISVMADDHIGNHEKQDNGSRSMGEIAADALAGSNQQTGHEMPSAKQPAAKNHTLRNVLIAVAVVLVAGGIILYQTVIKGELASGMVFIQGGTFTMGSPSSEPNQGSDETQHRVTVSSFYMSKYEVTQKEYQALMGTNPSYFKGDNLPVESVTWYDAVNYCNARSRAEGLTPAYTVNWTNVTWNRNANGYRLPTEAEWEYACRAGTTGPFSTGNNITTSQVNYDGNYPYNGNAKGTYRQKTTAVGSFAANAWGLYDMHGNVREWCWDWYGSYSSAAQTDPIGASSESSRVHRGGSWGDDARALRSASRHGTLLRNSFIGLRVVRPCVLQHWYSKQAGTAGRRTGTVSRIFIGELERGRVVPRSACHPGAHSERCSLRRGADFQRSVRRNGYDSQV